MEDTFGRRFLELFLELGYKVELYWVYYGIIVFYFDYLFFYNCIFEGSYIFGFIDVIGGIIFKG